MKIAILHHRVGGLDGVSLEIAKRKRILKNLGHRVILIAGLNQKGADYVLPDLSIPSPKKLLKPIHLRLELENILKKEKFEALFVHNILSLGRHPLAAKELVNFLDWWQGKTIAVHHDFYWERPEMVRKASKKVKLLWKKYLLPKRSYIHHVVINTLAARELKRRRGIQAEVMPDVFDFSRKRLGSRRKALELKKRLKLGKSFIVLQATRIVPRKGIELGINFAFHLQKHLPQKVVFFLLNYPDGAVNGALNYYKKLHQYANQLQIPLIDGFRYLGKNFSFWDGYHLADIISFPSLWEGYGNQFLEAMFFQKPIVVFECPVFQADIEPKGYKVLSLGNRYSSMKNGLKRVGSKYIQGAVNTYLNWRQQGKISSIVRKNFQIAKKNNSLSLLRLHLQRILR